MYSLFRPFLFRFDPETAHALTLQVLRFTGAIPPLNWAIAKAFAAPPKPITAFGLTFRNPVGLAAGYDKDAVAVRGLAALGFGHIEVGTVTPRPQEGNPRPRVFRLVEEEAVINRMGFPGRGAEFVARRLPRRPGRPYCSPLQNRVARNDTIIGVNLGKNKDTLLEEAANDYIALMHTFAPLADYLVINVSSPNTVGLRRLQGREMLETLLEAIAEERERLPSPSRRGAGACPEKSRRGEVRGVPILVKLAPDLRDVELDDAIGVILDKRMDGIIATNTTLGREGLRSKHREESGGLSGSPLRVRSEAVLREVVKRVAGKIPVISVGGIMTPEDAKRRLDMGAALVQVYTGLVYAGPGLVQKIMRAV